MTDPHLHAQDPPHLHTKTADHSPAQGVRQPATMQAAALHSPAIGGTRHTARRGGSTMGWQLLHTPARPHPRRCTASVVVRAGKDRTTGNEALDNALQVGGNLVNSAADLVPQSVPRGVAKGGVAVVGAMLVFWLLQKVVSTVLTIALLGGAAWLYFQYGGSDSSSSGSSGGSKRGSSGSSRGGGGGAAGDPNDPLGEARRIMDKYKD